MEYTIYPFTRNNSIKLYVVYYDEYKTKYRKSTGYGYSQSTSNAERLKILKLADIAAKKIVNKHFSGFEDIEDYDPDGGMNLKTFLEKKYYDYLRVNRKPGTLTRAKVSADYFLRICGNRPLRAYRYNDIEVYKNTRFLNEGISKITIDIEVRAIKSFFMKAVKWDFLPRSPYIGEDMLFKHKSNRRSFTVKEIEKLFEVSEGTVGELIFKLTYYTGMRKGEVSNLKWGMVNLENKSIRLPGELTKNGKTRDIPLSTKAMEILDRCAQLLVEKRIKHPRFYTMPDEECTVLQKERGWGVFEERSIGDVFRKARKRANLSTDLKFHCLRHSFATHAIERGAPHYDVSKILGHTTIAVTQQFYDHTTALNFRSVVELL
jgi:integrase